MSRWFSKKHPEDLAVVEPQLRIDIMATDFGEFPAPGTENKAHGRHYSVWYDGKRIITRATSPAYRACRWLRDRGHTGWLYVYEKGKTDWRFRVDIVRGAEALERPESDHGR